MTDLIPNPALAYRVLDHIDAHPGRWDQRHWCGTAQCFAGWVVSLSGEKADENQSVNGVHVADRAAQLLGFEDAVYLEEVTISVTGLDETCLLFDSTNTREDLGRLVAAIFGPRPEPTAVASGPHGVADYRQPLTDFERRAGVIEPDDFPPNAGSAS